jgi:hypothetical protein
MNTCVDKLRAAESGRDGPLLVLERRCERRPSISEPTVNASSRNHQHDSLEVDIDEHRNNSSAGSREISPRIGLC